MIIDETSLQAAVAAADWPKAVNLAGKLFFRSKPRDPRWAYAAALAEERRGQGAAAYDWMKKACKAGSGFVPAWEGRVRLALAERVSGDALAALDHVLALRPATDADRLLRGQLLLAVGQSSEAVAAMTALSGTSPKLRPAIAKALAGQPKGLVPWRLDQVLSPGPSSGEAPAGGAAPAR